MRRKISSLHPTYRDVVMLTASGEVPKRIARLVDKHETGVRYIKRRCYKALDVKNDAQLAALLVLELLELPEDYGPLDMDLAIRRARAWLEEVVNG